MSNKTLLLRVQKRKTLINRSSKQSHKNMFCSYKTARFICVVSVVSNCLVCDSSFVATCSSMPAACFAFVCVLFVLLCYSYLFFR